MAFVFIHLRAAQFQEQRLHIFVRMLQFSHMCYSAMAGPQHPLQPLPQTSSSTTLFPHGRFSCSIHLYMVDNSQQIPQRDIPEPHMPRFSTMYATHQTYPYLSSVTKVSGRC